MPGARAVTTHQLAVRQPNSKWIALCARSEPATVWADGLGAAVRLFPSAQFHRVRRASAQPNRIDLLLGKVQSSLHPPLLPPKAAFSFLDIAAPRIRAATLKLPSSPCGSTLLVFVGVLNLRYLSHDPLPRLVTVTVFLLGRWCGSRWQQRARCQMTPPGGRRDFCPCASTTRQCPGCAIPTPPLRGVE